MHDDLARRVADTNWHNLALGHSMFEADGATFVRNVNLPAIYDANFAFRISASTPEDIGRVLFRAHVEFLHAAAITFRVDSFTSPAFEAQLALDGYERHDALVMLLGGPLHRLARSIDIRPIADDSGWRAFEEMKAQDWREQAPRQRENPDDLSVAVGLARASRLKCPPAEYVLAYDHGVPIGHCSAWGGIDGIGQVEDLYVDPAFRRRGVATALLHDCVARARTHGAESVIIVADPTDTPKSAYAALGWQPITVCRQYTKKRQNPG